MSADDAAAGNQDNDQNNQEPPPSPPPPPASPQDINPPRTLEFDMFMMNTFRTGYCPPEMMQLHPHSPSLCAHIHPGNTRRRDPRIVNYSPDICEAIPFCPFEDDCDFCHNILEYFLHPRKFRKARCYLGLKCKRYPCLFPHNQAELFRATAKPPLYSMPPPPPPPCRVIPPLPPDLPMPPPRPVGGVPPPRNLGPLPFLERPMPSRFHNRLPRLQRKRGNDDEGSSSGTKRKRENDDEGSSSGTKRQRGNDDEES